jgi:hypothetical protein
MVQNASLDKRGSLLREICIVDGQLELMDHEQPTPSPQKSKSLYQMH